MDHKIKKGYQLSSESYNKVFNALAHEYPKLFNKHEVKLLKVGIKKEIVANDNITITKSQLAKFLKVYCSSSEYKKLHVENAKRYDLEGNKFGVVTREQIEGLVRLREQAKKNRELKKQKQQELSKKLEGKNNNNNDKVENKNTSKEQKNSLYSKANKDLKVKKPTVTQDNIGNIKSTNHTTNSTKPKLGIKL